MSSHAKPEANLTEVAGDQQTKIAAIDAGKKNLGEPYDRGQPSRSTDPLLTADDVAARLNVTKDWVWDHSSRKAPYLPVIRMGDGTLRYRASKIEEFIDERERLSALRRKSR